MTQNRYISAMSFVIHLSIFSSSSFLFPFSLPLPLAIQYLHSAFPSFTSTWHWIVFLCRIAESLTLAALQMLDRLRRHLSLEKSTSPAPIIRHVSLWTETGTDRKNDGHWIDRDFVTLSKSIDYTQFQFGINLWIYSKIEFSLCLCFSFPLWNFWICIHIEDYGNDRNYSP